MGPALDACSNVKQLPNNTNRLDQISASYPIVQFPQQLSTRIPSYREQKYILLANTLLSKNQKYTDQVYTNDKLFPFNSKIKWKRLNQVFPHAQLCSSNSNFNFNYDKQSLSSPQINSNFIQAVEQLKNCPKLIEKIFDHQDISEVGFYVLYLCINGKSNPKERQQVIIDDYIPVDSQGNYLLGRSNNNLVWMILLEKAWAKVLNSYNSIQYLSSNKIFQETTGIPLLQSYRPNYLLSSYQYEFNRLSSQYLKFTLPSKLQLLLALWLPLTQLNNQHSQNYNEFIMELIEQQKEQKVTEYRLYQGAYTMVDNKCILTGDAMHNKAYTTPSNRKKEHKDKKLFLALQPGQYILHIFNRSQSKLKVNLVVYSSSRVDLHYRQQYEWTQIKHIMIKNFYKTQHNSLKLTHQNNQITVRFCWSWHRGILCLKNTSYVQNNKKRIIISILPQYQNQIFFEDSISRHQKEKTVICGEHCFFVFVRKRNLEIGQFYQIQTYNV